MRTFRLDKLIRDKVLDNMKALGQEVDYRELSDAELLDALATKFTEEVNEYDPHQAGALNELVDILELVETSARLLGKDFESLRKLQAERRELRGGFDKKIYVDTVTLPKGDKWLDYYLDNPERFPEVGLKQPQIVSQFIAMKAVIANGDKVLLLRKAAYEGNGGTEGRWNLPGGRIERGEAWEDGLRREILEETGIKKVTIGQPLLVGEWRPVISGVPTQIVCMFMACKTQQTKITTNMEHSSYLWIKPEERKNYDILDPEWEVIDRYAAAAVRGAFLSLT